MIVGVVIEATRIVEYAAIQSGDCSGAADNSAIGDGARGADGPCRVVGQGAGIGQGATGINVECSLIIDLSAGDIAQLPIVVDLGANVIPDGVLIGDVTTGRIGDEASSGIDDSARIEQRSLVRQPRRTVVPNLT